MGKDERNFTDSKNNDKTISDLNISEKNTDVSDCVSDGNNLLFKQKLKLIYLQITNLIAQQEQRLIIKNKPAAKIKPFRTVYKGKTVSGAKAPVFFELKSKKTGFDDELPACFSAIDLEKIKKETDNDSFGEYLAFLREQRGLTVDDFCARAVINRSLYYSYLNKTKSPRKDTLKRMILILKLSFKEAVKLWALCGFGTSLIEDKLFFACLEIKVFDVLLINRYFEEMGIEQIEVPPER